MSDKDGATSDDGFVERPLRGLALAERLMQTADNGKAVLAKSTRVSGANAVALRAKGYRVRRTNKGAPVGMVYAWAEKIAPSA